MQLQKVRSLIEHRELSFVKQGLDILSSLIHSYEDLNKTLAMLTTSDPKNWKTQSHIRDGILPDWFGADGHHEYVMLWALGMFHRFPEGQAQFKEDSQKVLLNHGHFPDTIQNITTLRHIMFYGSQEDLSQRWIADWIAKNPNLEEISLGRCKLQEVPL